MQTNQQMVAYPDKTIGEQFTLAREALGLSLDEAAQKVRLRRSILQSIENNQFIHDAIPVAFMQGYVRNYAKFLKLPEDFWQQIDYGEVEKNDLNKNARTKKAVNHYASHGRWITYFTCLIIAIIIGMTLLWWWENYQQSTTERNNLVNSYVISENIDTTDKNMSQPPLLPTEHNDTNKVDQNENNLNTDEPLPTDKAVNLIDEQLDKEISHTPIAENQPILRIEITQASCWISVRDANRKILAEKEYKQGEVLNFNEGEHYSLIIGAPSNVNITYKGENVPLKVDGRVARLSLPAS